ncbi:uncharacterized protein JN550_003981 [Neoarthrinium moseri]|uniref:uncharacterized protein n=1 Tax=Neoarthrinium moseri TaxID=1658444 RepID=UPI001FDEA240|nr:uncharacterized protein JN550_003981 [Neoarthrinium moseri]KAI1872262.1 hypothetical protein JN550_003981 [Neoarthrinium moseri]
MPATLLEADAVLGPEAELDLAAAAAPEPLVDDTPPRPYTVFHEHVALDIDLREKVIKGNVDIFISTQGAVSEIYLDARQCEIDVDHITVSYCPAKAVYDDPSIKADTPEGYQWSAGQWSIRKQRMRPLMHHHRKDEASAEEHEQKMNCHPVDESLCVTIPPIKDIQASLAKHKELRSYIREQDALDQWIDQWDKAIEENATALFKINVPFVLKNIRDGLHFVGVDETDTRYPHMYTRHSSEPGAACSIFPCIDDPACRSSWRVSLTFPQTLGDAFRRRPSAQPPNVNGTGAGSKKRKHGDDDALSPYLALTEEDKMLELTAICSGKLEDEVIDKHDETKKTMTFTCSNKAARHIGFALGPFEHVDLWSEFRTEEDDEKLASNATKVHGYCLPGRADEVRNSCAALVTAMDHFALNYGRYPFDNYKMCFVDDMVVDTVPLCGFSLCSNRILFPRDIIDTEIEVTRTLVHALASQWFGITIIPNKKSDIWLVMGIAWFMTDLFMKSLAGNNWYRYQMKDQADRLVEIDMKRPSLESLGEHLHLGGFEVDFMNLKANLVLFILDRRLSKSSGSAGIARIIARMVLKANSASEAADEILTSENFRKACEKHGQTKLESFWAQWVKGSGCPRFDVHQKFNKKRLHVEMNVRQTQDIAQNKTRQLDKDDFWREVVEENQEHQVWAADMHHCFTGPMTIRIHEADGTPYEHIVEIRDENAKTVKFDIPYNTKYKRLKRNRRQRERQIAGTANKPNEENADETLIYCLGDVLQTEEDIERWDLTDWDPDMEAKMDQESYEWIRMDADFEWICTMRTNMPAYMYVSQLQQDKDVVAQQDSMLYLGREASSRPHPLMSTIITRTLVDARYFHGVRTMSAGTLPKLSLDILNQVGLRHLMMTFKELFYLGDEDRPRPNDFSDKRQYIVQCAIPGAVAQARNKDGHCPKEARDFILKQLRDNNNEENNYSDSLYICRLIDALATCLIPDQKRVKKQAMSFAFGDEDEEDAAVDPEPQAFKEAALEEIDRYRRMDEYSPSFQNCFTVATLEALGRLMKAEVIPLNPLVFTQYLQDMTVDIVRIKAFEMLVELKFMAKPVFLKFFLSVISTDRSPFIRNRLFKIFCRGLASIAFGEHEQEEKAAPAPSEGDLIVEQESGIIEAKQKLKARRENLTAALAALKEVTKNDLTLQEVVWKALDSPVLSVPERRNILELCAILFEEDDQFLVKFNYPKVWTCARGPKERGRCKMNFKRHFRTKSRKTYATPTVSRPEPPKRTITLNLNRAPSFKATTPVAVKPPSGVFQPPPKPTPPKPTISAKVLKEAVVAASAPRPAEPPAPPKEVRRDSISVQTPRPSIEVSAPVHSERKALPGSSAKLQSTSKAALPKPQIQKVQAPKIAPPKAAAPKVVPKSPIPPKPSGESRSNSLAPQPPKTLKRPSAEPAEGPRPTKIVKLNTKGIPASAFQKRTKVVRLRFKQWDRLSIRKQPSATPEAGSIRATPKGSQSQAPKERSNSIVVGSSIPSQASKPQSLHRSSAPSGSAPSPSLPSKKKSTSPPSLPDMGKSASGSILVKHDRKPLPGGAERKSLPGGAERKSLPSGGERKTLPSGERKVHSSGERTSLPSSGGRTSLPSASPHSTPSHPASHSSSSTGAPLKTKFKIKVKPKPD